MNLFQKHSEQNENKAKKVLIKIVKTNITKYILLQIKIDKILLKGSSSKSTVKELTVLFKKMLKLQSAVGECVKTSQLLFDDEIDVELITKEIADKHYPIKPSCDCKKCRARRAELESVENDDIGTSLDDFKLPKDASKDLKNLFGRLSESLKGSKLEGKVRVVNANEEADKLGLNPEDFESFDEFMKAVIKARKTQDKISKGQSPESIINNAIIESIEGDQQIDSEIKKDKLN